MSIRVKLSSLLRKATNWQEIVEMDESTPLDCLRHLEAKYPDIHQWIYDKEGNMWDRLQFFANGEMIHRDELEKPLEDGAEFHLLLNIGGG